MLLCSQTGVSQRVLTTVWGVASRANTWCPILVMEVPRRHATCALMDSRSLLSGMLGWVFFNLFFKSQACCAWSFTAHYNWYKQGHQLWFWLLFCVKWWYCWFPGARSKMKSNVVYSSIAANPSKFPSIFPVLTLSLDFPISIVIFCFLKNRCPKRKEKRKSCARFNSQSRFSKFDMGIFVAHAYSVALLVGEMSRCRCQQTLKIPVTSHKKKKKE